MFQYFQITCQPVNQAICIFIIVPTVLCNLVSIKCIIVSAFLIICNRIYSFYLMIWIGIIIIIIIIIISSMHWNYYIYFIYTFGGGWYRGASDSWIYFKVGMQNVTICARFFTFSPSMGRSWRGGWFFSSRLFNSIFFLNCILLHFFNILSNITILWLKIIDFD